MFQAIAAVIGAIFGFAGSVFTGTNQRYLQRQAEYEAAIQYQRDKELSIYGAVGDEASTKKIVIVAGVVALLVMVYVLNRKK